ncbi:hypothetical protein MUG91_G96n37 [Manis pentadactyla]|nr:hypothetical protein MUG91_G96n37 [Manis pentadactyla]
MMREVLSETRSETEQRQPFLRRMIACTPSFGNRNAIWCLNINYAFSLIHIFISICRTPAVFQTPGGPETRGLCSVRENRPNTEESVPENTHTGHAVFTEGLYSHPPEEPGHPDSSSLSSLALLSEDTCLPWGLKFPKADLGSRLELLRMDMSSGKKFNETSERSTGVHQTHADSDVNEGAVLLTT